mmetsp:Transcript_115521/g.333717  ORF Transcript_115521/g.333717 Transcript_115521/m.333717 type:complete len:207 (-) Transcript_115521:164-784(-)
MSATMTTTSWPAISNALANWARRQAQRRVRAWPPWIAARLCARRPRWSTAFQTTWRTMSGSWDSSSQGCSSAAMCPPNDWWSASSRPPTAPRPRVARSSARPSGSTSPHAPTPASPGSRVSTTTSSRSSWGCSRSTPAPGSPPPPPESGSSRPRGATACRSTCPGCRRVCPRRGGTTTPEARGRLSDGHLWAATARSARRRVLRLI